VRIVAHDVDLGDHSFEVPVLTDLDALDRIEDEDDAS
jgi:hypothetical protein